VSAPESVSAPELGAMHAELAGIRLEACSADIVEVSARCGRAADLAALAREMGSPLPAFGRAAIAGGRLALCVRPERWLLLEARAPAGTTAALWQAACAGYGVAVDLSSGLAALHLAGAAARAMLARTCRLDLDPCVFAQGVAAATIMAQVPATLASLPSGLLLLTPSTTARHLREWLAAAGKAFGLSSEPDLTLAELLGRDCR